MSHAIVATAANFLQDVIEASKTTPVLVDFWADWCGPCKQLMPIIERIANDYSGRFILAKVNTDEEQALASQVGIRSLPTVVLFKDGKVVDHFVGAVPESQVRQLLDKHVPPPAATPLEQARALQQAGDISAARLLVERALQKEPGKLELQCALAELQALDGELDAARQTLDAVQAKEPKAPAVKRLAALVHFSDTMRAHPDPDALRRRLSDAPDDLEARHALAVHRLLAQDYDAALNDWLDIMRRHRSFGDDLARRSLVMAFEIIGDQDPRVADTRRAMARMLF